MLKKSRSSRLSENTEATSWIIHVAICRKSNTLHSLFQIGNDIIYVFDTH